MSRESVLAQGRARVAQSMSETATAGSYRETANAAHATVRELVEEHYTGPASVEYPTLTVSETTAGEQLAATADVVVKVPVTAPLLPAGDLIRITASTADGSLVGREYRVKAAPQSGQVTSHRYPVEELS